MQFPVGGALAYMSYPSFPVFEPRRVSPMPRALQNKKELRARLPVIPSVTNSTRNRRNQVSGHLQDLVSGHAQPLAVQAERWRPVLPWLGHALAARPTEFGQVPTAAEVLHRVAEPRKNPNCKKENSARRYLSLPQPIFGWSAAEPPPN